MNVVVVGSGYVGLVSGACFAEMGLTVTCVDNNQTKIDHLRAGIIPIYEPGLDVMIDRNVKAGRIDFSTSLCTALKMANVVFIAVGTPTSEDGSADLKYVLAVASEIGKCMEDYCLVVNKSTVPVGTARMVRDVIQGELDAREVSIEFDVASNPEFLKEGDAIKDFMTPDRVVVGVDSERARDVMTRLYRPFLLNNFRVIFMDIASAELTKYAANAMLATRISFMNDIANLCDKVGADVNLVRSGIGSDTRIGQKFLYAGCGYGGSCFPKDVKALIKIGQRYNIPMQILEAVESVNEQQKEVLFHKVVERFGPDLSDVTVAVLGLAFKPNTDDMREAPSLVLIRRLLASGADVKVYDPVAVDAARDRLEETVYYGKDMYDTVDEADVLVLVTEWKEFRLPNWKIVKKLMRDNLVVDGRNIYDPSELVELGFDYRGIGVR